MRRFESDGEPIAVAFRDLLPWMNSSERATHYIHPYPAKLLAHIPAFFLANDILSQRGNLVLDPFCGSGTVLLESILHGRFGLGADSNPLARLIATAKVNKLDIRDVRGAVARVLRSAPRRRNQPVPDVCNIDYWFYPHVIEQLANLRAAIDEHTAEPIKPFLLVCLSVCVRRASLADPRLSVPVRLRKDQYPTGHPFRETTNIRLRRLRRQDVYQVFAEVVEANLGRMDALQRLADADVGASIVASDARTLRPLPCNNGRVGSADLIITSPPYMGAQKYIRSSSLSIGWLGLSRGQSLREIEDENIGREHFPKQSTTKIPLTHIARADECIARVSGTNRLRATIASTYLNEMRDALAEAKAVLKPGGYLVLITGSNSICGEEFTTHEYLAETMQSLEFHCKLRLKDDIKSRGLMTRRNKTAGVISCEWVQVFQKNGC
jgi:DNA modification methylase